MKHPSASNAEAFVRCTASHVLPQHENYAAHTEAGTFGHELVAEYASNSLSEVHYRKVDKAFPNLASKLRDHWCHVDILQSELAYVVDVQKRTSVCLGRDIGRDYAGKLGRPLGPYELGTSLDLAAVRAVDQVHWIRDIKFGTYASWWQLYIQAMAVLWAPGQNLGKEVDAGFLHIEAREDDTFINEDSATLYLMDLDDRADELMTAFGRAQSLQRQLETGTSPADLKVVEGKWCQYCGAFPHCPAKWKLAKSMLDLDVVGHVAALTPEQCGSAWLKLKEIQKNIIDKTKDALRQRMRTEGPFPLESGKYLKVIEMDGRASLDREATKALLLQLGATEDDVRSLFKAGQPYEMVKEVKKP